MGAIVGGAVTNATNSVIAQTGNGRGLGDVDWGQVGLRAGTGAIIGGIGFGTSSLINKTGITNKLLDATGISNSVARNIVGKTVEGAVIGTTTNFARGVESGVFTGEWNLWQYTWRGAAFGSLGGFTYSSLTELGYQAQLKWGRQSGLNSDLTEAISGRTEDAINSMREAVENLRNGGSNNALHTGTHPGIDVVHTLSTGITTVHVFAPNNYFTPPSPFRFNLNPNVVNMLRLRR